MRARPTAFLTLFVAACAAPDSATEVDAQQLDGVWVFTYSETPAVSMDALTSGQAAVADGCLEVGDAVVVWYDHHLDTVQDVIGRIDQGETVELQLGGGGLSLDEGSTQDDFPAELLEHCSPSQVWLSSDEPVTVQDGR